MKKELEMKLVEKYPILYSQYRGDPAKTCMAWGIAVGDGWYKIIDELSAKLELYGIVAAQVKEKFGGLRFYIESCPGDIFDEVHKLIDEAESLAYKTCESCGKPGTQTKSGWIKTLCEECKNKR